MTMYKVDYELKDGTKTVAILDEHKATKLFIMLSQDKDCKRVSFSLAN